MHWSPLEQRAFSEVVLPTAMKINRVFVSFISGPDRIVGCVSNLVISLRDCAAKNISFECVRCTYSDRFHSLDKLGNSN